jgi:hypothetical protein
LICQPYGAHWLVTNGQPSYAGVVLIDAEWRATWESVWDPTKYPAVTDNNTGRASGRGYVRASGSMIDIVLTNGVIVEHLPCAIQSRDLLHCYELRLDGKPSGLVILTRVGPGPKNLMSVLR